MSKQYQSPSIIVPGGRLYRELRHVQIKGAGVTCAHDGSWESKQQCQSVVNDFHENRKLNCDLYEATLTYVDIQYERNHVNAEVFLTLAGEQAMLTLNQGIAWNMHRHNEAWDETVEYWEHLLTGWRFSDSEVQLLSRATHPKLAALKRQLTYELVNRERYRGGWNKL